MAIHYLNFAELKTFKMNLLREEMSEKENINFARCYATLRKNGTFHVTNIDEGILIFIQISIPLKASFFLKEFNN